MNSIPKTVVLMLAIVAAYWEWALGFPGLRDLWPVSAPPKVAVHATIPPALRQPRQLTEAEYLQVAQDAANGNVGRPVNGQELLPANGGQLSRGAPGGMVMPRAQNFVAVDGGAYKIALDLAHVQGSCNGGERKACVRLDAHGGEARRLIDKMQFTLKQACSGRQYDACRLRGDLAMARGDTSDAETWYHLGRGYVTKLQSLCRGATPLPHASCAAADSEAKLLAAKEDMIAKLRMQGH